MDRELGAAGPRRAVRGGRQCGAVPRLGRRIVHHRCRAVCRRRVFGDVIEWGESTMAYGLDAFCRDCRAALKSNTGPGGREAVRQLLEKLLAEKDFLAEHVTAAPPGRHTLYEDPELGFVVLAHVNSRGRESPPPAHARSSA